MALRALTVGTNVLVRHGSPPVFSATIPSVGTRVDADMLVPERVEESWVVKRAGAPRQCERPSQEDLGQVGLSPIDIAIGAYVLR